MDKFMQNTIDLKQLFMANENEENRLSLSFEKAIKIVVILERVEKCVDLNSYYFESQRSYYSVGCSSTMITNFSLLDVISCQI